MTNQPDRFEKFVLPEGVRKVTFSKDTKVANAGTFVFEREDHTIGHLLRMKLHEDPRIVFAGYKIPHPLEYKMMVKVQTNGEISPVEAVKDAFEGLAEEMRGIRGAFQAECKRIEDEQAAAAGYGF